MESANGCSQRDSTRDSPASPSSRFTFSAVRRSTRSWLLVFASGRGHFVLRHHGRNRVPGRDRRLWRQSAGLGRCFSGGNPRNSGKELLHPRGVFNLPAGHFHFRAAGDVEQQINAFKQNINSGLPELNPAALGGNEAIFQGVGDAHCRLLADNARRAFERMCRAHQRFELFERGRDSFQVRAARR